MFTKLKNRAKGFTIIEVLIVLAIGGLIMLIVFLAVPALQRNSRNTQRSNDAANLSSALANFTSNNGGSMATQAGYVTADTQTAAFWCNGATPTPSGVVTARDNVTYTAANCPNSNRNKEETRVGFYDVSSGSSGNGTFLRMASSAAAPTVQPSTATCSDNIITINCVIIYLGYQCNPNSPAAAPSASARAISVYYVTESGSGNGNLRCS